MHQLNYFLLERLVAELRPRLLGAAFRGARTLGKGELLLAFEGLGLRVGFGVPSYCIPLEHPPAPRAQARAFFQALEGLAVAAARLVAGERVVVIDLAAPPSGTPAPAQLVLLLHGPRGNVLACSAAGQVLGSFRRRAPGLAFALPEPRPLPATDQAWLAQWPARLSAAGGARARALPAFDRALWAAVDERLNERVNERVDERADSPADSPADADADARLAAEAAAIAAVVAQARTGPLALEAQATPPVLRLAPPAEPGPTARPATATAALQAWWRALAHQRGPQGQHAALTQALAQQQARLAALAARLATELAALLAQRPADELGHLVLAQPQRFAAAGAGPVALDDFYRGGTVSLTPAPGESPQALAQRLYAQHRQQQARLAELPARQARLEARRQRLSQAAAALAALPEAPGGLSARSLRAWRARWGRLLPEPAAAPGAEATRRPYRRYRLMGYELRVGRSAADNDALTLRHCRPTDLWLHAHGATGSHVVVVNPRRAPVPSAVVEAAAGLAAWFSRARGAALVPVSVALRKHVRKGRGMAPGQVRLERADTRLVPPLDPASLDPTSQDPSAHDPAAPTA